MDETFAQVYDNGLGDVHFALDKREKSLTREEDVLMFYNVWAPPTEATEVTTKVVYGHYCNTGNVQTLLALDPDIFKGAIVMCKYGGGAGRPDKAKNVKPHGAVAVLVFSDPHDFSADGEVGYPEDAGIPSDAVQRGSSKYLRGDPTTPNYPSIPGAYTDDIDMLIKQTRDNVNGPHIWSPLPSQPISWGNAQTLLNLLDSGVATPPEWVGETKMTIDHIGPNFADSNFEFQLSITSNYTRMKSQNVIGYIKGDTYPDEYVLIGNHRDSWIHGTIDAGSGMTTVLEIARVFKEMNIRPKRTILFCSWGSEEHGLMGSEEFVEEFNTIIKERALIYINADVSFEGNEYFYAGASPIFHELVWEITKEGEISTFVRTLLFFNLAEVSFSPITSICLTITMRV